MQFLCQKHKMRYVDLLIKSNIDRKMDNERKALFYVLSSTDSLYSKISMIYNLQKNQMLFPFASVNNSYSDKKGFTYQERLLIRLALNLYNGYRDDYSNPRDLLYFDNATRFIAYNAVNIRFGTDMEIKMMCSGT